MIREAELEEMEREWRKQNEEIMKAHPAVPDEGASVSALPPPAPESDPQPGEKREKEAEGAEPQLPLPPP